MATGTGGFDIGQIAIGGLGQVLENVEQMRRAWTSLGVPSNLAPTVDVEELDKRIGDLKAVEQWLNLNLGMLRATIQGLEIQRGTLVAMRSFGVNFAAAANQTGAREQRASEATAASGAHSDGAREAQPNAAAGDADAGASADKPSAPASGETAGMPVNPGAWWELLQRNFNQVAEAAMSGVGLAGVGVPGAAAPAASDGERKRASSKTGGNGEGSATQRKRAKTPTRANKSGTGTNRRKT